MPNYTDFDLDFRLSSAESSNPDSRADKLDTVIDCATILTSIVETSLQYCPSSPGAGCSDGCTGDCTANDCSVTCSDCHSYCGNACRR